VALFTVCNYTIESYMTYQSKLLSKNKIKRASKLACSFLEEKVKRSKYSSLYRDSVMKPQWDKRIEL
jgi:hypothetical protein